MTRAGSYRPRFGVDIRVKPAESDAPRTRSCMHPGCTRAGDYRAPRDRDTLHDYVWFCLDHVREYNQRWDYFKGMSDDEVRAFQRDAVTGHRPTWGMGRQDAAPRTRGFAWFHSVIDDPHDVFGTAGLRRGDEPEEQPAKPQRRVSRLQGEALATLGLDAGASLQEVKARYKELVKRYHPDANGGDRGSEARLQQVIKAYGQLRASGFT